MSDAEATYEVLTSQDSRWVIESIHPGQSAAMSRAQALLATNRHAAVRVNRVAGSGREEIVFQQENTGAGKAPVTISSIDDAAVCDTVTDLSSVAARKTVGRILRRYLAERHILALELLHNYNHLRELQRSDRIFDQAIHRVGSLQARAMEEDAGARVDLLYRLAMQRIDDARDAGKTASYLTMLNEEGLPAALQAIEDAMIPEARPYFTNVVLADYVDQEGDWDRKLSLVLNLIDRNPDAAAIAHLDGICAEFMEGPESIKAILGPQPDLAAALRAMIRISTGRHDTGRDDNAPMARLNRAMAQYDMPLTQTTLMERVERALASTRPLTRENDAADRDAFIALMGELTTHGGLLGGPAISDALTRRTRIVLKNGEDDLSVDAAIDGMLERLPSNAVRLGYLLDLSRSEFGERHKPTVLTTLLRVVESVSSVANLLPADSSRQALALAVDDLRRRIGDDALGAEIGVLLAKTLGTIMDEVPTPSPAFGPAAPSAGKGTLPDITVPHRKPSRRELPTGNIIFREGDPGDEAYMILSGAIEISTRIDDTDTVLATLRRGEIFGEMALIDSQPRMATATAIEDTVLSAVPQETFKKRLQWLAEEDRMMSHVMEVFVARLRQLPQIR